MGWSQAAIDAFEKANTPADTAPPPAEEFEVWHDNWDMAMFFLRVASQWEYLLVPVGLGVMLGRRKGLNFAGCEAAARGLGLRWRKVFVDLQAMQDAVLEVDRETRIAERDTN